MELQKQIAIPPKRPNENIPIEYRSGNTDKILNKYIIQVEKEDEIIKRLLKALYHETGVMPHECYSIIKRFKEIVLGDIELCELETEML